MQAIPTWTGRRTALAGVVVTFTAILAIVASAPTASAAPASPATPANTVWNPAKVPAWVVKACRSGTVICIDKSTSRLVYMRNGKALLILDARFGDAAHPTREGTFTVYYKHANHVSSLYGSAMPWSMFFSGGEAIHYSSDFHAYGYAHRSHGCVNTRDWNGVKWVYDHTPIGTKVVVYR